MASQFDGADSPAGSNCRRRRRLHGWNAVGTLASHLHSNTICGLLGKTFHVSNDRLNKNGFGLSNGRYSNEIDMSNEEAVGA